MEPHDSYEDPLVARYASKEMVKNFSDNERYGLWRRLWIVLAEVEAELGLDITQEQIQEMRDHEHKIDYARVAEYDVVLRHDVMAHIQAFGEQCPKAKPIIHLGATSCYVTDNTDLILMRRGLEILRAKLVRLLGRFKEFALRHKDLPALSYTHLQPAQVTTVGKRAAMWAQDFFIDLQETCDRIDKIRFRGVKGTTGTQASFMRLFDGDSAKVEALDRKVSQRMGFSQTFLVSGQTYTRKVDDLILHVLSGIAQSAHKFSTDVRILQGFEEMEESFDEHQVGSTAMPYKRNPVRLERMSSLAKLAICEAQNPAWIHATQWFERTLDDSANRRCSIPRTFLIADAILVLANNVMGGLTVYRDVIRRRLEGELPFMASEDILMLAVRAGGDRQALHSRMRDHAMEVREARRASGKPNDLLARLAADPAFAKVKEEIAKAADPASHVGRAPHQVEEFFAREVDPFLQRLGGSTESMDEEVKL